MLARSRGEDSFGGFPPETPDSHFASFACGFFTLVDEDLLHFGAVVAAKFGGKQAEEHAEAFCGAAFGFGHDVPRIWTNRFEKSVSGSLKAAATPAGKTPALSLGRLRTL
jgi:hypothetical protein